MADPSTYRPAPGTIPTDPGVYKFRDENKRVVYVGKAKNLRSRLSNYFQDITQLHPRTRQMVQTAASVEWTVVASEVEALALEYTWIKKFDPRFNVKYRDDKTYPMLAVKVCATSGLIPTRGLCVKPWIYSRASFPCARAPRAYTTGTKALADHVFWAISASAMHRVLGE